LTELLLKHGAQVNQRMKVGKTALEIAANNTTGKGAAVIKLLLEAGTNPSERDKHGRTAGHMNGSRRISRWPGMSWEELVEATSNSRQRFPRPMIHCRQEWLNGTSGQMALISDVLNI